MRGLKGLFSKAIEEEVIDMKLMPFKTGYNPIGYKFGHLKKIKKPSTLIKMCISVVLTTSFRPVDHPLSFKWI